MGAVLVLAVVIALGSTANDSETDSGPVSLRSLDRDHDGWLSASEAKANVTVAMNFEALDSNQNQQLDGEEFAKLKRARDVPSGSGAGVPD